MQFFVVLLFCPLISALAFPGPKATPVGNAVEIQRGPRPTDAPNFKDFLKRLLKRQSSGSYTLIEGPDGICGYQFGSSDGGLGLCGSSRCGFATESGFAGDIYCFGSTTSQPRPPWTSCIGGTGATSCLADSACSDNPGIVLCTGSVEPYCNVGTFVGLGVEAVWCDSTYYSGAMIPVSTTYTGQIGRAFSTVNGTVSSSKSTTLSTLSSTTNENSTSTTIPSKTSTSTPTPTSSSTPTSFSSSTSSSTPIGPYASSTPAISPVPVNKKSTPVGPIIGGVIGALAVITGIGAGIFFCLRTNRTDGRKEQIQEISEPPTQFQPYTQNNHPQRQYPSDKYPAQVRATSMSPGPPPPSPNPQQQFQYQQPPPQPQYSSEKYPAAAVAAFSPTAYSPTSSNPEQQYHAPPQSSYQPQDAVQPTYNAYQPPQQQSPQQQPVQQNTYYSSPPGAAVFQIQSPSSPIQSDIHHRDSVVSSVSSPGSPAPPYANMVPPVLEMPGESNEYMYPAIKRQEMSGESNDHTYPILKRQEMPGESTPYPLGR